MSNIYKFIIIFTTSVLASAASTYYLFQEFPIEFQTLEILVAFDIYKIDYINHTRTAPFLYGLPTILIKTYSVPGIQAMLLTYFLAFISTYLFLGLTFFRKKQISLLKNIINFLLFIFLAFILFPGIFSHLLLKEQRIFCIAPLILFASVLLDNKDSYLKVFWLNVLISLCSIFYPFLLILTVFPIFILFKNKIYNFEALIFISAPFIFYEKIGAEFLQGKSLFELHSLLKTNEDINYFDLNRYKEIFYTFLDHSLIHTLLLMFLFISVLYIIYAYFKSNFYKKGTAFTLIFITVLNPIIHPSPFVNHTFLFVALICFFFVRYRIVLNRYIQIIFLIGTLGATPKCVSTFNHDYYKTLFDVSPKLAMIYDDYREESTSLKGRELDMIILPFTYQRYQHPNYR